MVDKVKHIKKEGVLATEGKILARLFKKCYNKNEDEEWSLKTILFS